MKATKIKEISDDEITVSYRGKIYTINITQELAIDENILNQQLKNIPSNYAFLCLLRDKSIKQRDKLERDKELAYAKAWVYYKESDSRVSNELATNKALTNNSYREIEARYLKALDKANRLISICKAYESRERILQTISANTRRQQ